LQDGGHFYVCGDASRMAKDVDAALRQIAMSEGGMTADQARDWIVALAKQGRYQRDVY
jgi:sulfite reductase (NADPH) flavoprotein alpha-component